jgi:1-deoxy-D-xylulose 5-phosphate reductoisomerase
MTDQEEAAETALELPVMLAGREVYVRMPEPEQLLVWQRTVHRLTEAPVDASWTGSQVMTALERLRKIVDNLFANVADRDWLDELFLDKKIRFQDLAPFITDVTTAFQKYADAQGNRETRRATKKAPAKKAARKKAAR